MELLIALLYLSQHRQNTALHFVITHGVAVNRKGRYQSSQLFTLALKS
jgi:hypothetical protein